MGTDNSKIFSDGACLSIVFVNRDLLSIVLVNQDLNLFRSHVSWQQLAFSVRLHWQCCKSTNKMYNTARKEMEGGVQDGGYYKIVATHGGGWMNCPLFR
jgi:hypothetical protein